jgi:hypothetical protein
VAPSTSERPSRYTAGPGGPARNAPRAGAHLTRGDANDGERVMAHGVEKVLRQAAFRSCATGAVVVTGSCHDITRLPGGLEANLDEWQAGFTDASGRFLDRREAAAAAGYAGRLEARAYFAGDASPTLEMGHVESWCGLRAA